jgi:hypothetical protein
LHAVGLDAPGSQRSRTVKTLVIAAVSSLAFAAGASAALAEDRPAAGGYLSDGREAGERLLVSETADNHDAADGTGTADAKAGAGAGVCGEAAQAASRFGGCGKTRPHNLTRRIDWSSVGPSTDDFASSDDGLRLQGARLIGKYRF